VMQEDLRNRSSSIGQHTLLHTEQATQDQTQSQNSCKDVRLAKGWRVDKDCVAP
jgi:hypothetical protein